MSNTSEYIGNKFMEGQTEGLAFSMYDKAQAAQAGETKTSYQDYTVARLGNSARASIAEPAVLAADLEIPDGPDCGHNALTVKNSGDWVVSLPMCHSFAFPIAQIVADDVLELYGPERFKKAKISFILQRTDFEPDVPYRNQTFSNWHTHDQGREALDLTYQFSDAMGTEFLIAKTPEEEFALSAPVRSLTRFGSEFKHRSPNNTSGQTLRRSWGGFIVYSGNVLSNHIASNPTLRPENIERALENGAAFQDQSKTRRFSRAFSLKNYANRFIVPDVPQGLETLFPNGVRYGFHSKIDGVFSAKLSLQEAGVKLSLKAFEKDDVEIDLPQDRWQIQQALMAHGAHPIEPINA